MDPLGFTASWVEVISRTAEIVRNAYFDQSALIERHENFIGNDLTTLVAFMNDVKNSFLNSKERPPIAAESSMRSCSYYLDQLENELHRVYGPNLNQKMNGLRRVRVQLGFDGVADAYRSLRDSVLLLKDLCLLYSPRLSLLFERSTCWKLHYPRAQLETSTYPVSVHIHSEP